MHLERARMGPGADEAGTSSALRHTCASLASIGISIPDPPLETPHERSPTGPGTGPVQSALSDRALGVRRGPGRGRIRRAVGAAFEHHGTRTPQPGLHPSLARLAIRAQFPRELASLVAARVCQTQPPAIPVPRHAHAALPTAWRWRPSSEGRACVACRARGCACSCHEHPTDHLKSQSP